jgi:hypothetical protein
MNTLKNDQQPRASVRAVLGVLLLIVAVILLVFAFGNHPSAQVCADINNVQQQLGGPPTCSTAPHTGLIVAAAVVGGLGVLTLAQWWLAWLTRKGSDHG